VLQVVDEAYKAYYLNELQRKQPAFNTAWLLSDLNRTVRWRMYSHDSEASIPHDVQEEEPCPAPKDTWARSAG
jgi:hypothetical protein